MSSAAGPKDSNPNKSPHMTTKQAAPGVFWLPAFEYLKNAPKETTKDCVNCGCGGATQDKVRGVQQSEGNSLNTSAQRLHHSLTIGVAMPPNPLYVLHQSADVSCSKDAPEVTKPTGRIDVPMAEVRQGRLTQSSPPSQDWSLLPSLTFSSSSSSFSSSHPRPRPPRAPPAPPPAPPVFQSPGVPVCL